MLHVMFYEVFKEEREAFKKHLPADIKANFTDKTIQASDDRQPPASLISVRTQSIVPPSWAKDLKGIITRSVGYDHLITYRRAAKANTPCGYLPEYGSRAVAEHAFLLLLALQKKLKMQIKNFDTFRRDDMTGSECLNKNVLVFGVGDIGGEIVRLARGWSMNVKGVDPVKRVSDIEYVSLDKGLPWADVLMCAAPLTDQTKGMLNYATLKKIKPGGIFVNISRGEISPTKDLSRLISEGLLGALGMDVFEGEARLAEALRQQNSSMTEDTKTVLELNSKDNVLFTPHNAFNTQEAVEEKVTLTLKAATQFLKKQTFPDTVPG